MCKGTESEETESETEEKSKTMSSLDLKFTGKNVGNSQMAVDIMEVDTILSQSEKEKIIDNARNLNKTKSTKDQSQEFEVEVSDDDLWSRRRSERIFLHGAISSPSILTDVPSSTPPVSKSVRCSKVASPKKGKEQRDNCKVCLLTLGRHLKFFISESHQ